MTRHGAGEGPRVRAELPAACAAGTALAVGLICGPAGPVRLAGAVLLLGSFVGAMWIAHQARFTAVGPAIGLAIAVLILIGLALAAIRVLSTVPVALAIGGVTLLVAWASRRLPAAADRAGADRAGADRAGADRAGADREAGRARARPRTAAAAAGAAGGLVVFAAAAVLAVHLSAVSATADADRASSLAVWAYPAGGQLQVGAMQPAGHPAASLRIVVTRAGRTVAAWNDVRLAAGQRWQALPLALTGAGPVRVVARRGGVIVASFSFDPVAAGPS